jgi:hypothetical protein
VVRVVEAQAGVKRLIAALGKHRHLSSEAEV